jgi:hypothetical protein
MLEDRPADAVYHSQGVITYYPERSRISPDMAHATLGQGDLGMAHAMAIQAQTLSDMQQKPEMGLWGLAPSV